MKNSYFSNVKNAVTFLILFLAFTVGLLAQTPQYYNTNTGTGINTYPWGQPAGQRVHWLIRVGTMILPTPCPGGNIDTIYFFMGNTASATFTNMTIKMKSLAITTLPAAWYTTELDTVYFRASVTLSCTSSGWMAIPLDHPVLYDTSKGLVIDVQQCGYSGIGLYVRQSSGDPATRNYGSPMPCPVGYVGQDGQIINFGVHIGAPPVITCTYSWATQTSGVTALLQAVCAVSDQVAWFAGATATVRKTIDGGATWTNANPNPGVISGDVYNIFAIDANNAWLTTSPSATYIYRTTNGGTNWTQVFTQAGGFIDAIMFKDASNGFAYGDPVGARWSLWKTTNAGATWDSTGMYLPQAGTEAGWNNAMGMFGNTVWFGTNNTRVYHSTNFGATGSWGFGATTGTANSYGVWFTSATNGMCVGTVALKTTNGGDNWVSAGTPGGSGNMTSVGGGGNYFWLTRGNNIYGTTDFGTTWTTGYTGTQALWGTSIETGSNGCLVGWSDGAAGTLVKLTGVPTGIANNNNQIPNTYLLHQNYPNPFNPSTKISFALPKAGNVELKVYDILGREVVTLVNEFRTAGNYTIDFNASALASGVYFYKIKTGDFTDTKKMVLMK